MPKKRRPLDSFKRTPQRRYDLPPQEETRAEHAVRFRKKYFDLPTFHTGRDRALATLLSAAMLLTLVNASAPMGDVPDVQTRFEQWAAVHNEKTIKTLPGPTPQPDSELAQAIDFSAEAQQQAIEQAIATPDPAITPEPTPRFKLYEPGELTYESDHISVEIEQKQKDGMTYFVCDIRLTVSREFLLQYFYGSFE